MKANVDIYYSEVEDIVIDESGSDTSEITGWDSDSSDDVQALNLKVLCWQNYTQLCISEKFVSTTQHKTSLQSLGEVKIEEATHMNMDSLVNTILVLFLMDVIQLFMTETNEYYNQYLNTPDSDIRCSGHTDMTTGNIMWL
jgi:hypothetical protein